MNHLKTLLMCSLCYLLLADLPIYAQSEVGVCENRICGPSQAFTVEEFPTIAAIDFAAFPANPSRPYQPTVDAHIWYVAPDGDDSADGSMSDPLRSPEYAVSVARSGDIILVEDGEYAIGSDEYEALSLTTSNLTIAAIHPGQVVFTPANSINAVGIAATADSLVVDGFVLRGFRSYGLYFGRLESPQQNLVLKHLVIEGSEDAIRSVVAPSTPHTQPIIEGLLLYDVWIAGATNIGFNCGEGPCNNVRFEALRVGLAGDSEGSGADAVAIESGENIVVLNADISGASADGLDFKTQDVAVANVVVHDVGRNGIKLWHGGDVINALVYNTGADAALVFDSGGEYRILNSVIARHARPEIAYAATVAYDHPDEPGHVQVINSIFYENTGALWVSPTFELEVRNSIFFGWRGAMVEWRDLAVGNVEDGYATFQILDEVGGGCCNPGIIDPLFSNPDDDDYSLQANSPAHDTGTEDVEAFISFDLYGNPRIMGDGVDIGPIEMSTDE